MNILEIYLQNNREFMADLEARSEDEKKYDDVILNELRKGKNVKQALKAGEIKYPDEAWAPRNKEEHCQIEEHYNYLLEHEKIMSKLKK